VNGETSASEVLFWLFDHYEEVRASAGLKPLAANESLTPGMTAKLRMRDALVTLPEFGRTRAAAEATASPYPGASERASATTDPDPSVREPPHRAGAI